MGQLLLLIWSKCQLSLIQFEAASAGPQPGERNLDPFPAAQKQVAIFGQAADHFGKEDL